METLFKPYMTHILITGEEHIVPKLIYVDNEVLDKYIAINKLSISPKFMNRIELSDWLSPINLSESVKYAVSLIETEEQLEYMIMKSDYIVHNKKDKVIDSKVIDIEEYKKSNYAI